MGLVSIITSLFILNAIDWHIHFQRPKRMAVYNVNKSCTTVKELNVLPYVLFCVRERDGLTYICIACGCEHK